MPGEEGISGRTVAFWKQLMDLSSEVKMSTSVFLSLFITLLVRILQVPSREKSKFGETKEQHCLRLEYFTQTE